MVKPFRRGVTRSLGLCLLLTVALLSYGFGPLSTADAAPPQALADGWAQGTTGGLGASPENIRVVTTRSELVQALGGDNANNGKNTVPTVIYIRGTVNLSADDQDRPLGYEDYRDPAYTFDAYLAAYDPAVWGWDDEPSGPLEEARVRSQKNQAARIVINIGSNVTIAGLGTNARIVGGTLMIRGSNVILRNLHIEAPYDYFPQWDPTDGSAGNWNSEYDAISVRGASRVWIDHNTVEDGDGPADGTNGSFFGRKYEHYDGLLDITHSSDLVTVSYNHIRNHDKTMLIGSSDSRAADVGKLRTTIHHNYFENIGQRAPRVRYGQVHVYNNYYYNAPEYEASYAIGVGRTSQIYSEANSFEGIDRPVAYYDSKDPGAIEDVGSLFVESGAPVWKPGLTWNPADKYAYQADPAEQVKAIVLRDAGAGRPLPIAIQIKPGEEPNAINLNGRVPVAVLTTAAGEYGLPAAFDSATVDPITVRFGPAEVLAAGGGAAPVKGRGHLEDSLEPDELTQDGDLDLVLLFEAAGSGLSAGATEACLWGTTQTGLFFSGCGPVQVVPPTNR